MEEMSEQQVAELVDSIETTGEAPQEQLTEQQVQQLVFDGPDALMKHKLEYSANGKTVSEDIATILKRASQGYNYAQLSHELKSKEQQITDQWKKAQEIDQKWSRFESYAKENPQWYDHWNRAWELRDKLGNSPVEGDGGDISGIDARLTTLLDQRLGPIQEFIQKQQAESQQAAIRQQDQALDAEIKETRKKFSSIDFDQSDPETGKTLEWQVLEFAHERGMGFEDAFKVFYHDKLLSSRLEEEKTKWAKDQESNFRRGILGKEPSTAKTSRQPDFSQSSWDQVAEYAAKSLGFS